MKENHLFSLISQQSDYIDQLEKSNLFLKYELGKFQSDLKAVIEENKTLFKDSQAILNRATIVESNGIALKTKNIVKSTVIAHKKSHVVNQTVGDSTPLHPKMDLWKKELENVKTMYTNEISKLKQELLSSKNELKLERLAKLISKTSQPDEHHQSTALDSVKNLEEERIQAKAKELVDELLLERKGLLETICGLNQTVKDCKSQEKILRQEVQKSLVRLEEMQLENSELLLVKDNIADQLQIAHSKLKESVDNTPRVLQETVDQYKKEYSLKILKLKQQVSDLELSLSSYKQLHSKLENQNMQLQSDVQSLNDQLLIKQKSLTLLKVESHAEVKSTARANDATEIELRDKNQQLENDLQVVRKERIHLEQKCLKLSTRLENSQKEALSIQELNLKLLSEMNDSKSLLNVTTKKLKDLEKEHSVQCDSLQKAFMKQCSQQANNFEVMEAHYRQRLQELEGLSSKQSNLINELKAECFSLEAELTKSSHKYESEVTLLNENNTRLILKAKKLLQKNEELMDQCVQHGVVHRNMKQHLNDLHLKGQKSTHHMLNVLSKQIE